MRAATLNWPSIVSGFPGVDGGIPDDLPLDVWVNEYAQWGQADHYRVATPKAAARRKWLAANPTHKFWWYWCLSPEPANFINTFVERPAIDTRLLLWLAALHAVDGLLYYQIDLWSQQCPTLRPCKPLERINSTSLTDFDPRTFSGGSTSIHSLTGGANGGGNLVYPGESGPVASNRMVALADGIEDCPPRDWDP
jgi:hypothetical protein